jgi:hypothetical protein
MKKQTIYIIILLLLALGAVGAYYSSTKTQNVAETNPPVVPTKPEKVISNPPVDQNNEPKSMGKEQDVLEEVTVVSKKEEYFSLNLVSKKIELLAFQGSFEKIRSYTGLPATTTTATYKEAVTNVLPSINNKEFIVGYTTFDLTKPPDAFAGDLSILSRREFICNSSTKHCAPTDIMKVARKNVANGLWVMWDSGKKLLYGHLAGEGIGHSSPVYVYDTDLRRFSKTTEYGAPYNNKGGKVGVVSYNSFSPSGEKVLIVDEHQGEKVPWDLVLYNTDDLTHVVKKITLSILGNLKYPDGITFTWRNDENMIALASREKLYTVDLQTGTTVLVGNTPGGGSIVFSPTGRFIVHSFVDIHAIDTMDGNKDFLVYERKLFGDKRLGIKDREKHGMF